MDESNRATEDKNICIGEHQTMECDIGNYCDKKLEVPCVSVIPAVECSYTRVDISAEMRLDIKPIAAVYVLDGSGSLSDSQWVKQYEGAADLHNGFREYYADSRVDPKKYMRTGIIQFSHRVEMHVDINNDESGENVDIDIFSKYWQERRTHGRGMGTPGPQMKQHVGGTYYKEALNECVKMLGEAEKSFRYIEGRQVEEERMCILLTDGRPADCTQDNNECADITRNAGIKLQTMYVQENTWDMKHRENKLEILSRLSECDHYKVEESRFVNGHPTVFEAHGFYANKKPCPYMKAITSTDLAGELGAYEWMKTKVVVKIVISIVQETFCEHGGKCTLIDSSGSLTPKCECKGTGYASDRCHKPQCGGKTLLGDDFTEDKFICPSTGCECGSTGTCTTNGSMETRFCGVAKNPNGGDLLFTQSNPIHILTANDLGQEDATCSIKRVPADINIYGWPYRIYYQACNKDEQACNPLDRQMCLTVGNEKLTCVDKERVMEQFDQAVGEKNVCIGEQATKECNPGEYCNRQGERGQICQTLDRNPSTQSVVLTSRIVNESGNVTITFTTAFTIPTNGRIEVTFPYGFSLDATTELYYGVRAPNPIITHSRGVPILKFSPESDISALTQIVMKITNVRNPPSSRRAIDRPFKIESFNGDNDLLDFYDNVAAGPIYEGTLSHTSVKPASQIAAGTTGATGPVTIKFTTDHEIPHGGKIVGRFPTTYNLTAAADPTFTRVFGKSFGLVDNLYSPQTLTSTVVDKNKLELELTGPSVRVGEVEIKVDGIGNPRVAETGSSFTIETFWSGNTPLDYNASVPAIKIYEASISGTPSVVLKDKFKDGGDYVTVTFTTATTIDAGDGKIAVTFPTDFEKADSTLPIGCSRFTGLSPSTLKSVDDRPNTDGSRTVTLNFSHQINAASIVEVVLTNVKNPPSARITNPFTIETFAGINPKDFRPEVKGVPVYEERFATANVQFTNRFANQRGTVTITFTPTKELDYFSTIEIKVPAGLVIDKTQIECQGEPQTSVGFHDQILTLRNCGTTWTDHAIKIVIRNVKNPSTLGSAGLFWIATSDRDFNNDNPVNYSPDVESVTIVQACDVYAEADGCVCNNPSGGLRSKEPTCSSLQWCNRGSLSAGSCTYLDYGAIAIAVTSTCTAVSLVGMLPGVHDWTDFRRSIWGVPETVQVAAFAVQGVSIVVMSVYYLVRRFHQKKLLQNWILFTFLSIHTIASLTLFVGTNFLRHVPFFMRRQLFGGAIGGGGFCAMVGNIVLMALSSKWQR
jgi:hypothetical protein